MAINLAVLERFLVIFIMLCLAVVAACVFKTDEGQDLLIQILPRDILKLIIARQSPRVEKLMTLNEKYTFLEVPPQFFHKSCASKAEYDRVSMDDFFALVIKQNNHLFQAYDQQIKENHALYMEYLRAYLDIESEIFRSGENKKYKTTELALFEDKKKTISYTYSITLTKGYISPTGRSTYNDKKVYRKEDIETFLTRANQIDLEKEQRRSKIDYERSLMTSSLRYDILKRDHGRCVLCGASPEDGVKLHVDHIIPVSKGGKTTPENLRTLCDRCNIGKKDKYDPNGFN